MSNKNPLSYYIALVTPPGIGPVRFSLLLKYFKSVENVWKADEKTLRKFLTPTLFTQFIKYRK